MKHQLNDKGAIHTRRSPLDPHLTIHMSKGLPTLGHILFTEKSLVLAHHSHKKTKCFPLISIKTSEKEGKNLKMSENGYFQNSNKRERETASSV